MRSNENRAKKKSKTRLSKKPTAGQSHVTTWLQPTTTSLFRPLVGCGRALVGVLAHPWPTTQDHPGLGIWRSQGMNSVGYAS